jgi:hypothetical protein
MPGLLGTWLNLGEVRLVEFPVERTFPVRRIGRGVEQLTVDIEETVERFPFTATSCLGDSLEIGTLVVEYSLDERLLPLHFCRKAWLNMKNNILLRL